VSNFQIFRNHQPQAFHLSLTRGDSCCHACDFHLPSHAIHARPSGVFCNPLKNLLGAVIGLFTPVNDSDGLLLDRITSFEWDCEPAVFAWKFRRLRKVTCFRLVITYRTHACDTHPAVIVDTVLEENTFAKQVWESACTLLRESGIAFYDQHDTRHTEFPLGDFLRVHEIVTGEPVPSTLAEELAVLNRLVTSIG
jgi:hypothetical protein